METATRTGCDNLLSMFLAGLQAGLIAALAFLAWMGATSLLQRRGFWTAENLMASVFYGNVAIRRGPAMSTLAGLALYLALYSLVGALFAAALRDKLPGGRRVLACILFGLCWYFVSFHLIWKSVAPLVTLLHVERTTIWGHAIYGALLGRYAAFAETKGAKPEDAPSQTAPETAPPQNLEHQPLAGQEKTP